jgi:alpha/beta superfamily hydrolase
MEKLAENGILCVLVHMPGNLAVLDVNAAEGIQEMYPEIKTWYIGGHSLGGAMAASYAAKHSDDFSGLILLGAYSTVDLTDSGLAVLSVYGSRDGVLDKEKYEKYFFNLPDKAEEVVIEGGCHSYFGSYGMQEGDGTPTITREQQMEETVEAITGM